MNWTLAVCCEFCFPVKQTTFQPNICQLFKGFLATMLPGLIAVVGNDNLINAKMISQLPQLLRLPY